MCARCGTGVRWRDGRWCAACLHALCCSRYPRWDETLCRMVCCVHGGRDGEVARDLQVIGLNVESSASTCKES